MEINQYYKEIVGLTGAMAAATKVLYDIYCLQRRSRLHQIDHVQRLDMEIYRNLREIVDKTDALRAMVLYVHNGGEVPQVGKCLYSTVSHEVVKNSSIKPVAHQWSHQRVDEVYTSMLVELMNNHEKKINIITDEMQDSMLKTVYKSNGITRSKICHIYTYKPKAMKFFKADQKGRMWYLSVNFTQKEDLRDYQRDAIRYCLNNIQKIMKDQYKFD